MFFENSQGTSKDEIQSLWIVNPVFARVISMCK